MSESRAMLIDTARNVFAEAKQLGFAPIKEAGFESLLIAENKGGFGGDYDDLFAVMRLAGAMAMTQPVGEAILTAKMQHDGMVGFDPQTHRVLGAFLRVAQAAGALDAALAMSVEYANTRIQFGKPLSKQQAVQQNLAIFASEAAAVNVAGQAAARALDKGDALFEIAAAKLRTNTAIGIGTAIAHQVHGAIGFTQEYALHPFTTALMGWRSEFGNDAYWAAQLGAIAAKAGGAGLWAEITRRGDR
jgi:acyl-CoA dehydrogenase